ncbi:hypothetical protein [Aquamicrobium defluvii]|nr:hypothetical protein [Aquamicrobium defluvii]
MERKVLHFNLKQAIEITHYVSPSFKHKSTCDWPFECQLRTFPLNILLDVERRLAAFPLHVPSQEKSAAKALEADITAKPLRRCLLETCDGSAFLTSFPQSNQTRLSDLEQVPSPNWVTRSQARHGSIAFCKGGRTDMRLIIAGAAMLLMPHVAFAADVPVPAAELKTMVVGKTIKSSGARLRYGADGRYTFNGASPGKYTISSGKICVKFDAGDSRCDRIVKSGNKYFMINSRGKRFPFN